jgi:tRNA(fMet)-specific endonuclease VapC
VSYLVDSDVLIDGLSGRSAALDVLARLRLQGLAVSIVSYGEVFEGAFKAPDPLARLAQFRTFLADFALVPLSDPVMETFARLRAELRSNGQLISDLDTLIAATALHHNLTIVTRNLRHFERIPELTIYRFGDGSGSPSY